MVSCRLTRSWTLEVSIFEVRSFRAVLSSEMKIKMYIMKESGCLIVILHRLVSYIFGFNVLSGSSD